MTTIEFSDPTGQTCPSTLITQRPSPVVVNPSDEPTLSRGLWQDGTTDPDTTNDPCLRCV
jgi:hypothetical protein